jgi:triacylglycerol lipase
MSAHHAGRSIALTLILSLLACNTDNAAITQVPKAEVQAQRALAMVVACIQTYRDFIDEEVVPPQGWVFREERFFGDDFFFSRESQLKFGLIFREEGNEDHLMFAFRGTDTTTEWWDDAQANPVDFVYYEQTQDGPDFQVEDGFFSIYKTLRSQLFDKIRSAAPSEITITGHSLGSALATLFLYEIQLLYPEIPRHSYNFASPRVGESDFVAALSAQEASRRQALVRFRNLSDVVPDVPLTWEGYEHTPLQFSLDFKEKSGLLPDLALRHSADNYFLALREIFSLPDFPATLFNEKQDDFILLKE